MVEEIYVGLEQSAEWRQGLEDGNRRWTLSLKSTYDGIVRVLTKNVVTLSEMRMDRTKAMHSVGAGGIRYMYVCYQAWLILGTSTNHVRLNRNMLIKPHSH